MMCKTIYVDSLDDIPENYVNVGTAGYSIFVEDLPEDMTAYLYYDDGQFSTTIVYVSANEWRDYCSDKSLSRLKREHEKLKLDLQYIEKEIDELTKK